MFTQPHNKYTNAKKHNKNTLNKMSFAVYIGYLVINYGNQHRRKTPLNLGISIESWFAMRSTSITSTTVRSYSHPNKQRKIVFERWIAWLEIRIPRVYCTSITLGVPAITAGVWPSRGHQIFSILGVSATPAPMGWILQLFITFASALHCSTSRPSPQSGVWGFDRC